MPETGSARRGLPTAFIGDSHLLPGDATTGAFVEFLESAPARFERLVLVGDIFDLWIARRHVHFAHHDAVLDAIARSAARGLAVDYVVGNRDYGVETLAPSPFQRVASESLVGPAWVAEHGDLANPDDARYRAWRAFSRSRAVLGAFLLLPGRASRPLSLWLERRLRTTNLTYKRGFPHDHVSRHADAVLRRTGTRFIVFGHFHEERRFAVPHGDVLVLPDWKRARRHAEWRPDTGEMMFAPSLD